MAPVCSKSVNRLRVLGALFERGGGTGGDRGVRATWSPGVIMVSGLEVDEDCYRHWEGNRRLDDMLTMMENQWLTSTSGLAGSTGILLEFY